MQRSPQLGELCIGGCYDGEKGSLVSSAAAFSCAKLVFAISRGSALSLQTLLLGQVI